MPGNPFVALRRDFERKLGLDSVAGFGEMSVVEFPDRWVISVDVPGVSETDLDVTFEDDTLVIAGERKLSMPEEAQGNLQRSAHREIPSSAEDSRMVSIGIPSTRNCITES